MTYELFETLQKKTSSFNINSYVQVKPSSSRNGECVCQPLTYAPNADCVIQTDPEHAWYTRYGENQEAWLEFDIEKLDTYIVMPVIGYIIQVFHNCNYPISWKLSGKNNDNEEWNTIHQIQSGSRFVEKGEKAYLYINSVTYTKYRLDILKTNDLSYEVGLKFFDLFVGVHNTPYLAKSIDISLSTYCLIIFVIT